MTIYRALSGMSYTVNTHTSLALKSKHSVNIYSFGMLHTLEQFQLDQTFATANRIVKLLKACIFLLGFEYCSHIPKKNSMVMTFLFIY